MFHRFERFLTERVPFFRQQNFVMRSNMVGNHTRISTVAGTHLQAHSEGMKLANIIVARNERRPVMNQRLQRPSTNGAVTHHPFVYRSSEPSGLTPWVGFILFRHFGCRTHSLAQQCVRPQCGPNVRAEIEQQCPPARESLHSEQTAHQPPRSGPLGSQVIPHITGFGNVRSFPVNDDECEYAIQARTVR